MLIFLNKNRELIPPDSPVTNTNPLRLPVNPPTDDNVNGESDYGMDS